MLWQLTLLLDYINLFQCIFSVGQCLVYIFGSKFHIIFYNNGPPEKKIFHYCKVTLELNYN